MSDYRALVRDEIARLGFSADRERKVVEELSLEIAEIHESFLARGLTEDAAREATLRQIPPWPELLHELLEAEPVLRTIHPDHAPFAGPAKKALASRVARVAELKPFVELRFSLRRLWKSRAFTAAAVLTLAVCLGTNAAIFSIVEQALLNPLPVPEPSRILVMANQFPNAGAGVGDRSAPRNYFDRLRGVSAFSEQAMFTGVDRVAAMEGNVRVHGMQVTPSFFRLVRVPAALGRTFVEQEGETGDDQSVVLSHGMWQELYAGDRAVVGTQLRLDGQAFTIVGVMPDGFSFLDPDVRFWVPLVFNPAQQQNAIANNWYNIGRLAPGATLAQAQAEVDAVNRAFLETVPPQLRTVFENAGYHTTVEPLEQLLTRGYSGILYLLWAGATVVLLIGGINVANLSLARAQLRHREIATRMALGADRARLAALLLADGLTVAAAGAILGLFFASTALGVIVDTYLSQLAFAADVRMRPVVIVFVLGLATLTGAALGLAPLVQLKRLNLIDSLQLTGRASTGRSAGWVRRVLVTSQVALTFVLLATAGLLLATIRNLLTVDPGYSVENVVTAAINLPQERYPDVVRASAFLDEALAAIRNTPGVASAAASTTIPLSGRRGTQSVITEDDPKQSDESLLAPNWVSITPGFFGTLGTSILAGRDLEERDNAASLAQDRRLPRAVIVDETLARTLWPGVDDVLGKRLFLPGIGNALLVRDDTRWLTVVGVVPDLLLEALGGSEGDVGTFFTPYAEANRNAPPRDYGLVIKAVAAPESVMPSVRQAIARIDPQLVLFDVRTLVERSSLSLARERLAMLLAGGFASIALFLSALGVYGMLSYLVAQRRREFGIRIALGSTGAESSSSCCARGPSWWRPACSSASPDCSCSVRFWRVKSTGSARAIRYSRRRPPSCSSRLRWLRALCPRTARRAWIPWSCSARSSAARLFATDSSSELGDADAADHQRARYGEHEREPVQPETSDLDLAEP